MSCAHVFRGVCRVHTYWGVCVPSQDRARDKSRDKVSSNSRCLVRRSHLVMITESLCSVTDSLWLVTDSLYDLHRTPEHVYVFPLIDRVLQLSKY